MEVVACRVGFRKDAGRRLEITYMQTADSPRVHCCSARPANMVLARRQTLPQIGGLCFFEDLIEEVTQLPFGDDYRSCLRGKLRPFAAATCSQPCSIDTPFLFFPRA